MEPALLKQVVLVEGLELEQVLGRLETLHLQLHHKETMVVLVLHLTLVVEAVAQEVLVLITLALQLAVLEGQERHLLLLAHL